MYENGDIEIDLDWPKNIANIKELASNYAALISVLNFGGFKDDIKKILIEAKQRYGDNKNSISYKFVFHTLNRIAEAQKITELNSDKPIIGPKQVFTYHQKQ